MAREHGYVKKLQKELAEVKKENERLTEILNKLVNGELIKWEKVSRKLKGE